MAMGGPALKKKPKRGREEMKTKTRMKGGVGKFRKSMGKLRRRGEETGEKRGFD